MACASFLVTPQHNLRRSDSDNVRTGPERYTRNLRRSDPIRTGPERYTRNLGRSDHILPVPARYTRNASESVLRETGIRYRYSRRLVSNLENNGAVPCRALG